MTLEQKDKKLILKPDNIYKEGCAKYYFNGKECIIRNLKKTTHVIIKTLAILICPFIINAQDDPYPPGTVQMTPEVDLNLQPVPLIVPEKFKDIVPPDLNLNLPEGFSVKVFAVEGLRGPRMMAFNKDGILHVANMKAGEATEFFPNGDPSSQIVALPDKDNDGVADTVIVAADKLRWANSLVFYKGDMYVADAGQIVKFSDADGDLVYEQREVFVDNIPEKDKPHMTRTIAVNDSTGHFYLSIGSFCDVCRDEPEHAAVLEFNADGSGRRVFASGLRNAIGLDIHPVTGDLWAANNGHTEVDTSMPPEWIDIVRDGGFYGWPLAFGYQVYIDFDFRNHWRVLPITKEDSLQVQTMQRPAALVDAHVAPMDIHFYPSGNFPEKYHNAAFVAYRAGARKQHPGYKVVALFVDPDGSDAQVGDFLTGFWPAPPGTQPVWAKPVGLASDSQGNLYLSSDWINNFILKIEYDAGETTALSDDPSAQLPSTAVLHQNYPNPFNPETNIKYDVKTFHGTSQHVNLSIYNLQGQKVATLVDQRQGSGDYSVKWDAQGFSSGIYIYKLSVGSFEQSRKMILIR